MTCPVCDYPLIVNASKTEEPEKFEAKQVLCTHCKTIFNITLLVVRVTPYNAEQMKDVRNQHRI